MHHPFRGFFKVARAPDPRCARLFHPELFCSALSAQTRVWGACILIVRRVHSTRRAGLRALSSGALAKSRSSDLETVLNVGSRQPNSGIIWVRNLAAFADLWHCISIWWRALRQMFQFMIFADQGCSFPTRSLGCDLPLPAWVIVLFPLTVPSGRIVPS